MVTELSLFNVGFLRLARTVCYSHKFDLGSFVRRLNVVSMPLSAC